ncbi:hypothetical protein CL176_04740 [Suicoccus acidiformans]|uniref:Mga helix-turn-helix domain-containing protein n=1 Tax=Suicoccus acidiformans TaxID=2036206 RepID=A0A347WJV4_9LACT|nr:helix-turn-helix domain-containing protein [Suicoccus acidiformans]AXY25361.1 hypothetical protein CL176_04740 [Suicoccus acidiformans]
MEFLNKVEKRQLNLIKLLYQNSDWITYGYLSEAIGVAKNTVSTDISYIEEILGEGVNVEKSTIGIRANFNPGMNLLSIQRIFFNHSISYKLIEDIFIDYPITKENLSTRYDISRSSLYRYLNRVSEETEKFYHFTFEGNPLYMKGQEEEIQNFYVNFFLDKVHPFNWPFKQIDQQVLDNFINFILDSFRIDINYEEFRYVEYVMSVTLLRMSLGFVLEVDTTNPMMPIFEAFIQSNNQNVEAFRVLVEALGIELTATNFSHMIAKFYETPFLNYGIQNIVNMERSNLLEETHRLIGDIVDILTEKYELQLNNRHHLMNNVNKLLHMSSSNLGSNELFFRQQESFLRKIRAINPDFYKSIYELVDNKLINAYQNDAWSSDYLVAIILLNWENIYPQLLRKAGRLKVYVMSFQDVSIAKTQVDLLSSYLEDLYDMHLFEGREISEEMVQGLDCDVIISDLNLPTIKDKRIVSIQSLPTVEDIHLLLDLYYEILYGVNMGGEKRIFTY